MKLEKFTRAYIAAALWSSCDDNGNPLDSDYDLDDISAETFAQIVEDCRCFRKDNRELLEGIDDEQAGHDFWLTRCGHGAGFWDRGLGEVGEKLTEACKAWGNVDLYVGDDGKIHA